MNYLQKKKKAMLGVVNNNSGFLKSISGVPPIILEDSLSSYLSDYQIHGDLVQDGTPSPAAPVAIESVGEYDVGTGKYKIEIATGKMTTCIYLDEPLRKLGDYADYIDFKNKQIVRYITHSAILNGWLYTDPVGKTYPCLYRDWAPGRLAGTPIKCTHDIETSSSAMLVGAATHIFAHTVQSTAAYCYWGISRSALSPYSDIELNTSSTKTEISKAFTNFCTSEAEKGNPVTLYYVLRYPVYETLSLPRISVNAGTDTFSVNTSVKPSKVTVGYFSKTP